MVIDEVNRLSRGYINNIDLINTSLSKQPDCLRQYGTSNTKYYLIFWKIHRCMERFLFII